MSSTACLSSLSSPTLAVAPLKSHDARCRTAVSVRCSQSPIRRPSVETSTNPSTSGISTSASESTSATSSGVTIEFQRQRAKELVAYFEEQKIENQLERGKIFGFNVKNEIGNGRWAMFGIAVGLLTEFATGVDFPEQLKIIVSNLGIADLD